MKTKKFFSVLATLVGVAAMLLTSCSQEEPKNITLTLSKSTVSVEVGATTQLTATITPEVVGATVTFSSSNTAVATVAGTMQAATITGVAEGSATITATYEGKTATCTVQVIGGGGPTNPYDDFAQLQGSKYYVYFLDAAATEYLGDKVIYNFGPNNFEKQGSRWLYIWNDTFVAGTATGTDPFDQGNSWTSLVQGTGGWAGAGLCVAINDDNNVSGENAPEDKAAAEGMATEISDFSQWYFAYAIKNSTSGAGYTFAIAPNAPDGDKMRVIATPAATGEWIYGEVCLEDVDGLEFPTTVANGTNVLTFVANPYMAGAQMDLGYAFIYKK